MYFKLMDILALFEFKPQTIPKFNPTYRHKHNIDRFWGRFRVSTSYYPVIVVTKISTGLVLVITQ